MTNLEFISAAWSAPKNVRAVTTTRAGGISHGVYSSLNLGDQVGDEPERVQQNRALVGEALHLPAAPVWLKQVHGVEVLDAAHTRAGAIADGAYANRRGVVCAVLTADCLPVFICDRDGTTIALLHAGWRGLAAGVIEAGVKAMGIASGELIAHVGPGIGPDSYEVGDDVRATFTGRDSTATDAFRPRGDGRWLADMPRLAQQRLRALGICDISVDARCTFRERDMFFSYRRDGVTGRMGTFIWLD